ncbi:MAG: VOC family protein [Proteobacteria bacterium]|nr:MAG: VOC family protein [Pseudomonadota bacterium]
MKTVSLLTLGVSDLEKSKAFFRALFHWEPIPKPFEGVAFYDMGGWLISLFSRTSLAKDAGLAAEGSGFRGIAIAHNVGSRAEVGILLARAAELGGKIVKPAEDVFWGGHSGYFHDLDGHLWEIAWNPGFPLSGDGSIDVARI